MSRRKLNYTSSFKKDYKKISNVLAILPEWIEVLYCLLNNKPIPKEYKDHELQGDMQGYRDCHILPDLVLLYKKNQEDFILVRLGSHSELKLMK